MSPTTLEISDYWTPQELSWDIATMEAMAVDRDLKAFREYVKNSRVDVNVDNQAVIQAWNNHGRRSHALNDAIKILFLRPPSSTFSYA